MSLDVRELLLGVSRRLSTVYRYSSIPVHKMENVAEHSYYCAFYAMAIGIDLISQGVKIDMADLLQRAIVHDLDEALTGDFLRRVKYSDVALKKALDAISVHVMDEMSTSLGIDVKSEWHAGKEDGIEGYILAIADFMCVVAYLASESVSGNTHISPIFGEVRAYFESLTTKMPPEYRVLTPYVLAGRAVCEEFICSKS